MNNQTINRDRIPGAIPDLFNGFTLIEILVVLLLLSLIAFITFPRLNLTTPASEMRATTRKFAGLVKYVRGLSATENRLHKLYIDLDEDRYWVVYMEENGEEIELADDILGLQKLNQGISFIRVDTPGKLKATEGLTSILFFASGEVEGTEIIMSNGQRKIRLRIHPLTGKCDAQWEDNEG